MELEGPDQNWNNRRPVGAGYTVTWSLKKLGRSGAISIVSSRTETGDIKSVAQVAVFHGFVES